MKVAVVGGGAWGIALAVAAARAGSAVRLWARDPATVGRRLPGARLEGVRVEGALSAALDAADVVVFAVPVAALADVARAAAPALPPTAVVVSAAKGFEEGTGRRPSEAIEAALRAAGGRCGPVVALSGPSFAADVVAGLPTSDVLASADAAAAGRARAALGAPNLRFYLSRDIIGVEAAGALKNPIAIAAGAAAGLALGASALGALVARGLAEMTRLVVALGGEAATVAGLAGAGDLVATATSPLSRNRRFGERLARGLAAEAALAEVGATVEGIGAARQAVRLAAARGIEVPITDAVRRVIEGELGVREAVGALMARPLRDEA